MERNQICNESSMRRMSMRQDREASHKEMADDYHRNGIELLHWNEKIGKVIAKRKYVCLVSLMIMMIVYSMIVWCNITYKKYSRDYDCVVASKSSLISISLKCLCIKRRKEHDIHLYKCTSCLVLGN